MKMFRRFRNFEYGLMIKSENPETPEINIKLCKLKKTPSGNGYCYQKTAKVQPICFQVPFWPYNKLLSNFSAWFRGYL